MEKQMDPDPGARAAANTGVSPEQTSEASETDRGEKVMAALFFVCLAGLGAVVFASVRTDSTQDAAFAVVDMSNAARAWSAAQARGSEGPGASNGASYRPDKTEANPASRSYLGVSTREVIAGGFLRHTSYERIRRHLRVHSVSASSALFVTVRPSPFAPTETPTFSLRPAAGGEFFEVVASDISPRLCQVLANWGGDISLNGRRTHFALWTDVFVGADADPFQPSRAIMNESCRRSAAASPDGKTSVAWRFR